MYKNTVSPDDRKMVSEDSLSELPEQSEPPKPPEPPEDRPLEVGKNYLVKRIDSWNLAELLLKKFNKEEQRYLYYVHFNDTDRRWDQWVPRDQIEEQKDLNKTTDVPNLNDRRMTRHHYRRLKRDYHNNMPGIDIDPTIAELEEERTTITRIKCITKVQLGNHELDTWYYSPFPAENQKVSKIWICGFCLKYSKLEMSYRYHLGQCAWKQPPGDVVYKEGSLSIWEVDPTQHKIYCQNLCLLAKLFIDHKTVFFDVEPFLFYVLCKFEKKKAHFIGYFSKEKISPEHYNVACILIMPHFQLQGYGKLLIQFSYELSKLEGIAVSPEEPLSDLGKVTYQSYWAWVLLEALKNTSDLLKIQDLCVKTSIAKKDIISTLKSLNLVKYWKGEHVICVTPKMINQLVDSKWYKKPKYILNRNSVKWTPKEYTPEPEGPVYIYGFNTYQ